MRVYKVQHIVSLTQNITKQILEIYSPKHNTPSHKHFSPILSSHNESPMWKRGMWKTKSALGQIEVEM